MANNPKERDKRTRTWTWTWSRSRSRWGPGPLSYPQGSRFEAFKWSISAGAAKNRCPACWQKRGNRGIAYIHHVWYIYILIIINIFSLNTCLVYLVQRQLQELTLDEWRELGRGLFERQPGLIFDALMMHQRRHGGPPSAGVQGVPWCVCGNCREMPTDLERKCCGQQTANCISRLPSFSLYCLDASILRIHRNYREDITALGIAREPGDDNREYRYAAYRSFIYWQHGAVGRGNRLVIPSCCVWQIRDKWPDPHGCYTGFTPGH